MGRCTVLLESIPTKARTAITNHRTTETRNLWITPFLQLLGYRPEYAGKGEELNGRNYAISHRDHARDGFPIHVMGWRDELDRKRSESGGPRMSPHALVQEYLNLTEHLYSLVTNGRLLRLLRDSSRLVKLSFLEFDLERIFEEELFANNAILYRLLHVSRMPLSQDTVGESIIELYHQFLDSGTRIRGGLSIAVDGQSSSSPMVSFSILKMRAAWLNSRSTN